MGLWKLKELWILLSSLTLVALQMAIDWLITPSDWPVVISDLNAAVMTKLIGRDVTKVETDEKYSNRKLEDMGAGGTGTSRAWLTLTMADGEIDHVFVKLPTESLGERMFLTVFGVYRNELNFYENIRDKPQFPDDLFSKVYCAKMRGTRFVLVLENIAYRGGVSFPPIIAPYPKDRAELVLRSFATLHAANWGSPPKGCWTDQWSALQTSPPGKASEGTRPPALRLIFENTLEAVVKRYGFPDDVKATYIKFIENEPVVRKYWSTQAPLTMCWGDGHYGNMFFREADGVMSQGFYDAQCVAAEHGMRDVAYHLTSAYDPDALERDEAFVVSAGASDLMVEGVARPVLDRIARAARRLDTAGALDEVLAAAKKKKSC